MSELPAYLRIAAELRARIVAGELAPGAKLPTESALMAHYGVSRTVAKYAMNVLKSEGLVEGRRGSGVYVRTVRRIVREAASRDRRTMPGPASPFARDVLRSGQRPSWNHHSERGAADQRIAARLAIEPGAPVMRTTYRFLAEGEPIQVSTSWEPLSLTAGTPVEWPESGPAVGVVARMDRIGIHIDQTEERVTARSATPEEIEALKLSPRGALVLVIMRTYTTSGAPVETADIVLPGDRYEMVYRTPID